MAKAGIVWRSQRMFSAGLHGGKSPAGGSMSSYLLLEQESQADNRDSPF